jgi:transposase
LALAAIYDGGSRSDAARTGGVGVPIVRDWVVRFNAKGFDGLLNGKAPGARSILDDSQRQALRRIVEDGPIPAVHSVVRWRLIDLAQWVFEEFRSPNKRSVASCAPWASASSRQGRAITRKTWKPLRILKTYGPPRLQAILRFGLVSLRQRIRSQDHRPGQDGDPRIPVLIKLSASNAIF